jgi:nucleotide-binding universal stress UspA family protein
MGVTLPFASVQDLEAETQRNMASALERVTAAGHPAETIVRVAHERGADLIVMGTHGRTGLPHVLLGSVAEKVVQLAPCPVLTVRRAP